MLSTSLVLAAPAADRPLAAAHAAAASAGHATTIGLIHWHALRLWLQRRTFPPPRHRRRRRRPRDDRPGGAPAGPHRCRPRSSTATARRAMLQRRRGEWRDRQPRRRAARRHPARLRRRAGAAPAAELARPRRGGRHADPARRRDRRRRGVHGRPVVQPGPCRPARGSPRSTARRWPSRPAGCACPERAAGPSRTACGATRSPAAGATSPPTTTWATTSTALFSTRRMTYSSAVFADAGPVAGRRAAQQVPRHRRARRPARRRARARDRLRLGRLRALRRRRARLPGHDDHDLAGPARAGPAARRATPGSRTGSTSSCATTARSTGSTTPSSRSRCSRPSAPSTSRRSSRPAIGRSGPGGRISLQSITFPDVAYERQRRGANWIQTYIFPGGLLPSLAEIERSLHGTRLLVARRRRHRAPLRRAPSHAWRTAFLGAARRRAPAGVRRALHPDVGLLPPISEAGFATGHHPGPADRAREGPRPGTCRRLSGIALRAPSAAGGIGPQATWPRLTR